MADGDTYPRAATEAPSERIAKMEIRLENGQKEFMALREEQRALRAAIEQHARDMAPKPMSRLQVFAFIAGPVVGVALVLGGFVWQAARYPDRGEFNAAQSSAVESARETEKKLLTLEGAQALQAQRLEAIGDANARHESALDKIDAKLDRLLITKGK
jgi:uncharacterized coiled-coil protein SlyX